MDSFEATIILEKIIRKGGLIGRTAKLYAGDKEKAAQFIKECSEQCKNRAAQELWGEELVRQIQDYSKRFSLIE